MDLENNPFTLRSLLIPTFKADFSTRVSYVALPEHSDEILVNEWVWLES